MGIAAVAVLQFLLCCWPCGSSYAGNGTKSVKAESVPELLAAALAQVSGSNDEPGAPLQLSNCLADRDREKFVRRMINTLTLMDGPTRELEDVEEVIKTFASALETLRIALEKRCSKADLEGVADFESAVNKLNAGSLKIGKKVLMLDNVDIDQLWSNFLRAVQLGKTPKVIGWRIGDILYEIERKVRRRRKTKKS